MTAYSISLVGLSLLVASAFLAAVVSVDRRSAFAAGVGTVAWLGIPGGLAAAGLLSFSAVPPTMLLCVGATVVCTVLLARSGLGARLASRLPLAILVGFQAFRILVELWLHRGHELGVFPVEMTYAGWNFDIAAGLLAIAVAVLYRRGVAGRRLVMAFNIVGLLLLANIVTIAILAAPTPFQVLMTEPPNVWVTGFPGVWLPTVLVQAALLGHLLVFRALSSATISPD